VRHTSAGATTALATITAGHAEGAFAEFAGTPLIHVNSETKWARSCSHGPAHSWFQGENLVQDIHLASGATEADIMQALATVESGGTVILPEGETIAISKGLIADISHRDITLDLNGATLQQVGAVSVILAKGQQTTAESVELGLDAQGNATISYAALPAQLTVGTWVKMVSDDPLPGDKIEGPAPTLMGQAMQVASIDGNVVTFEEPLIDQAHYTTNIRAAAYQSGEFTVKNGEVIGDSQSAATALVQFRDAVNPHLENLSIHDGVGYGVGVINSVNAELSHLSVVNMQDGAILGIAVHSLSSTGTTVKGLYAENVTHAADANAIGATPGAAYISQFGADIGFSVSDSVAYDTRNFAWSWHSESVNGNFDNVMAFNSYGFMMARGIGGTMTDSGGAGNLRGTAFYEWGHEDARGISLDHITLKETQYYSTIAIENPLGNTLSNSFFESYGAGNTASADAVTVTDTVYVRAGENADDVITGSARNDLLLGGKGNDTLDGAAGDDYVWGGIGADILTGGAGQDRFAFHSVEEAGDIITDFQAGVGGDVIDLSVIAAKQGWGDVDLIEGGYARFVQDGPNVLAQIDVDGGGDGFVAIATLLNIDASLLGHANFHTDLWAPEPADEAISFDYPHAASANVLNGGTADDTIVGDDANNQIYGNAGGDRLYGGAGEDLLVGGEGDDQLGGGAGNDMLHGGAGADWLNGNAGYDTVTYVGSQTAAFADLSDDGNNAGSAAGDRFNSIENLTGTGFDDVLSGNQSNNVLDGGAGNDQLYGGGRTDTLIGGAGNDWLDGGAWKDVLTGGDGADGFSFASAEEAGDTITDFTSGQDKIVMSASGFGIEEGQTVNFDSAAHIYLYAGNALYASSSDPTLLYDYTTGRLLWDADGHGEQKAQLLAVLTDAPEITFDDFLIV
jgi:Ca2+-binding RTX toxin-like protein